MTDKNVYILIPAHNRRETTLACLSNLQVSGALEKFSVVLVDDGSTDGTSLSVAQNFPTVHVLKGNGQLWWTGAMDVAMRYAYNKGADYLIWLNDDCQVQLSTLQGLIAWCAQSATRIVGCQGYNSDNVEEITFGGKVKTWRGYRWLKIPIGETSSCDLLSGNLVCMPRSVIEEIGYPDTKATPHYGGDSLYLIRAKKAGFQLCVDARSPVYDTATQASLLYPDCWLLAEGAAWRLIELAFIPQSGLSWRIWLSINWESYGLWGLTMFSKKYLSIVIFTFLRLLPLSSRKALYHKMSIS